MTLYTATDGVFPASAPLFSYVGFLMNRKVATQERICWTFCFESVMFWRVPSFQMLMEFIFRVSALFSEPTNFRVHIQRSGQTVKTRENQTVMIRASPQRQLSVGFCNILKIKDLAPASWW
jgi:hypothetical protein